jgi:NAD(P)-dependent dehydrogenase (short-subunit alcohol dehydrogenase family)
MLRLDGKVAFISGAGSVGDGWGNGKATAVLLARQGARVFGTDIREEAAGQTRDIIQKEGGTCEVRGCDMTRAAEVESAVAECLGKFGRIDILVNNVGGGQSGRIWEADVGEWDFIMRLNLRSAFLCTREAAAHMRQRRSGRIVNLSSGSREGTPWMAYYAGNSAYAAAKAAIHGFTRNVALELAEYGVTVNAVAPGPIETERNGAYFRALESLEYGPLRVTPLRRLGVPSDIANAVLYLVSDEASYVTGTTLSVAGGR